jgi:hypothetical protein
MEARMTKDWEAAPAGNLTAESCTRCAKGLTESDRVVAGGKTFCRDCYEQLRERLEAASPTSASAPINYVNATVGALLGGTLGALAWWGFTVATHISFGLVAVVIGIATGLGAVRFAGNRHSHGLQVLAVVVAVLSFFVATYLVDMSLANAMLAKQGASGRVPFPPSSFGNFVGLISSNFGIMDFVFLLITAWRAWWATRPPAHSQGA